MTRLERSASRALAWASGRNGDRVERVAMLVTVGKEVNCFANPNAIDLEDFMEMERVEVMVSCVQPWGASSRAIVKVGEVGEVGEKEKTVECVRAEWCSRVERVRVPMTWKVLLVALVLAVPLEMFVRRVLSRLSMPSFLWLLTPGLASSRCGMSL